MAWATAMARAVAMAAMTAMVMAVGGPCAVEDTVPMAATRVSQAL